MERRRSVTRALALFLLALSVAWLAPSRASADEGAYRQLAQEATTAMAERRLDEALRLFQEMHAMAPSARTLWSLGRVHHEMGHYVRAMRYLALALEDPRRPLDAEQRMEAEALARRAEAMTGLLEVRLPAGARAEDVDLLVDDEVLGEGAAFARIPADLPAPDGEARVTLRVDSGEHTVRLQVAGRSTSPQRVTLTPGGHVELRPGFEEGGGLGVAGGAVGVIGVVSLDAASPGPAVRTSVELAIGQPEEPLALSLQPLVPNDPLRTLGPLEALCEVPCERTVARGTYRVAVSRRGADPLAGNVIDLVRDSRLLVEYADNEPFRIWGTLTTGLVVAGGAVMIGLGADGLGGSISRDDASALLVVGVVLDSILFWPTVAFPFMGDEAHVAVAPLDAR